MIAYTGGMDRLYITLTIVTCLAAAVIFLIMLRRARRRQRRQALFSAPFPDAWENILADHMPLINSLPDPLQRQLYGHVQVFLDEKTFEGCGGLEITDTIRVIIAAQACLLLLNRPATYFPSLSSIVVYPSAYVAKGKSLIGGQITEEETVRLGESWTGGDVVLAWDNVKQGAWNIADGHNVVFHEFAHQLDQEDGAADGAPILSQPSAYAPWARVLGAEFQALQKKARRGRKTVLDRYGATNPAEFFAVATETFFEKPKTLQRRHSELYDALKSYYAMDPAGWA